ncbi:MAG TPA: hypothetical protein ENK91_01010 [Bacteroidetes bacterium]|nr:hypothetical protein [Bacteroidota bacterium]
MNRSDFLKRAAIALGGVSISDLNSINSVNEELEFLKNYMDKYVDFTDIPEDLDLAEKALTAFIHGQLSKSAAVKILMFTDDYTEAEAIEEIDNLKYEDEIEFIDLDGESNTEDEDKIHIPFGFAD